MALRNSSSSLREVGLPSRLTLHGRGVGSKSRIGVRVIGGSWTPLFSTRKSRFNSLFSFLALRRTHFLGPGMRVPRPYPFFDWSRQKITKRSNAKESGFARGALCGLRTGVLHPWPRVRCGLRTVRFEFFRCWRLLFGVFAWE